MPVKRPSKKSKKRGGKKDGAAQKSSTQPHLQPLQSADPYAHNSFVPSHMARLCSNLNASTREIVEKDFDELSISLKEVRQQCNSVAQQRVLLHFLLPYNLTYLQTGGRDAEFRDELRFLFRPTPP